MRSRFACAIALMSSCTLWAMPGVAAPSFGIAPFKVQVVPDSPARKSQMFELENGGNEPQAIQIRIEDWLIDIDGKEHNIANTTSFSVYPEQFVLQPQSRQAVRVTCGVRCRRWSSHSG